VFQLIFQAKTGVKPGLLFPSGAIGFCCVNKFQKPPTQLFFVDFIQSDGGLRHYKMAGKELFCPV
jgi:hypothetical protein